MRLVLFYDAGQVRDYGEQFAWKESINRLTTVNALAPADAADGAVRGRRLQQRPEDAHRHDRRRPTRSRSSTGAEIRFFMPVLNVPFRLIFAANPSRTGVLDNNLQPEKKYKFRFAVGTTF